MKICAINLSWFRGASSSVSIETEGKSMVIYGENASGKSSFVDAVEYLLRNGTIGHLQHEYSGSKQEKAIINVRKPSNVKTEISITCEDNSELKAIINQNGSFRHISDGKTDIKKWDYIKKEN